MRKKFDKEFKRKAVELSYAKGNASEIAEELEIDREMPYWWRKEFNTNNRNSFPRNGDLNRKELEHENALLQEVLSDAKLERDILKKAIRIFSNNHKKPGIL